MSFRAAGLIKRAFALFDLVAEVGDAMARQILGNIASDERRIDYEEVEQFRSLVEH